MEVLKISQKDWLGEAKKFIENGSHRIGYKVYADYIVEES